MSTKVGEVHNWSQQAYVKASNSNGSDNFGDSVTLSGDGKTLAVGAFREDGGESGIGGNQGNSASEARAVYVFVADDQNTWSQRAYVKASNTDAGDFGRSAELWGDGNTLAVGAYLEDSSAAGIGGNQASNSASSAGSVYLY